MKKLTVCKPEFPFGDIISLDLATATVEEFKDFIVKYIYDYKVYLEDYSAGRTDLIDIRLDPRFIDYMGKFYDTTLERNGEVTFLHKIAEGPAQILADTPAQEYQELLSFLRTYKKPKNAPYYL